MTAELQTVTPLPGHERTLECTQCRQIILVCGYVNDLDPNTYMGVVCGCRKPGASE